MVYNWTAGHADSGLLQTSNINSNVKRPRNELLPSEIEVVDHSLFTSHFWEENLKKLFWFLGGI